MNRESLNEAYFSDEMFVEGLKISIGKQEFGKLGQVSKKYLQKSAVNQPVYYAEIDWETVMNFIKNVKIAFKPLAKYPEVRRDFALLIDENISFAEIKKVIKQTERNLLKGISLFDVSVILQNENATLNDKQIEKVSQKLQKAFEKQLGASLR